MSQKYETATLGAGCFWCVEAIFQELNGVERVVSGYSGGSGPQPTYAQICTGKTGYAEVIQITFDPLVISFADLLTVFWRTHNPTTLNRQGADMGTQYRSIILYHNETQKAIATQSKTETDASSLWPNPIVTEITPFHTFYAAEEYHQDYYRQNAYQPYCRMVIDPKMQKFRATFSEKLKNVS